MLKDGADGYGSGVVIVPDVAKYGEVAVFLHQESSEDHADTVDAHGC
jgi:hypothetical protein